MLSLVFSLAGWGDCPDSQVSLDFTWQDAWLPLTGLHAHYLFSSQTAGWAISPLLCPVGAGLTTEIATLPEGMKARSLHAAHPVEYVHRLNRCLLSSKKANDSVCWKLILASFYWLLHLHFIVVQVKGCLQLACIWANLLIRSWRVRMFCWQAGRAGEGWTWEAGLT